MQTLSVLNPLKNKPQNTQNCDFSDISNKPDSLENITDNRDIIRSVVELSDISSEHFKYDMAILQSFIDTNASLGDLQYYSDSDISVDPA